MVDRYFVLHEDKDKKEGDKDRKDSSSATSTGAKWPVATVTPLDVVPSKFEGTGAMPLTMAQLAGPLVPALSHNYQMKETMPYFEGDYWPTEVERIASMPPTKKARMQQRAAAALEKKLIGMRDGVKEGSKHSSRYILHTMHTHPALILPS
jgi:hypothetical protein